MILVNAANGQQGRLLVPKLLAAGRKVRACVHTQRSADELRSLGVDEVLVGDLADPNLIAAAVRGISSIYHVCPGIQPRERELGMAWIAAARAQRLDHFVFSSVLHPIITDLVQHEIKRDIEECLVSSGLEFTILQPTIYMAPRRFGPVLRSGVLNTAWSLDRRQSLVDIGDVTDVALAVLTDGPRHAAATYQLAGAERLTAHDMAATIAKVLGRAVEAREIAPDAYLAGLFGDRDPAIIIHETSVARSLTVRYSSHDFVGNPNVLTWLLGREPTTFEAFVTNLANARD